MNERIKELMDQAGIDVEAVENLGEMPTALKFAELIVRECAKVVDDKLDFENASGPDDWASGADVLAHFGVEE